MALYQVDRGVEAYPPFPQEHHGIVWRQLESCDLHALSALFARMEARDNPPYRTALAEVEEMLSPASSWWGIAERNRAGENGRFRSDTIALFRTY